MDLLTRAGWILEGFDLSETMKLKFPANAGIWGTFLGACHAYNNVKLGKVAAERLMGLELYGYSNQMLLCDLLGEME